MEPPVSDRADWRVLCRGGHGKPLSCRTGQCPAPYSLTGVVPCMEKRAEHCSSERSFAFQTQIHIVWPMLETELVFAAPQEALKVYERPSLRCSAAPQLWFMEVLSTPARLPEPLS